MIVKNEEKYLRKCLSSVQPLVDEMIIVDTGSTDGTISIAKEFDAKIFYYEWDQHFSHARNYSLQQAKGDWILLMDGDDEFESEDYEAFHKLVDHSTKDAHYFKTLSYVGNAEGNNIVTNMNLRLLRNNHQYEFKGAIHEQITKISGKINHSDFSGEEIRIYHYGYLHHVAQEKNKRERNITIIERELEKDPYNSFHLFNLGNEYYAMGDQQKALECFDQVYKNINWNAGYAAKVVIRRILCLDELKNYALALQAIDEGIEKFPKYVDLELIRGWIYMKLKRYTLAIESFQHCIELGKPPINLEFINGAHSYRPNQALGDIYFKLEDYEKAYQCYEKMLPETKNIKIPLLKMTEILNKNYGNKKYVSYQLSTYFHLEYVPNLIMLSAILVETGLWEMAEGYLEKAKELEATYVQIDYLLFQTAFYQGKFDQAKAISQKIPKESEFYLHVQKLLLIQTLIQDHQKYIERLKTLDGKIQPIEYKVYEQIYFIVEKNPVNNFDAKEDHEEILTIVGGILNEILKVQEFKLFESLLPILNMIESPRVLLSLAKIYHKNGYSSLAVKEVLRSIKELSAIDEEGAEILYKLIG